MSLYSGLLLPSQPPKGHLSSLHVCKKNKANPKNSPPASKVSRAMLTSLPPPQRQTMVTVPRDNYYPLPHKLQGCGRTEIMVFINEINQFLLQIYIHVTFKKLRQN